MQRQFTDYPIRTLCILGVAGGNGLEHIDPAAISRVYGIDVNPDYLAACALRFPALRQQLRLLNRDLTAPDAQLPPAELVVANLLVEYVGLATMQRLLHRHDARYVSCVIQQNRGAEFVSDSPYQNCFDDVARLHEDIDEAALTAAMDAIGLALQARSAVELPRGKRLLRLDFIRGAAAVPASQPAVG